MQDLFKGIAGWTKNSFIDYPGTVSTVLFFSQCNLRCPYCHNKELVENVYSHFENAEKIVAFLSRRKELIDGIVLSGGEPTIHENCVALVKYLQNLGFKVKLDTNGLLPDVIKRCKPDYCALDIKTIPKMYGSLLGAKNNVYQQNLLKSIDIVRSMGEDSEIRITVAPEIITEEYCKIIGEHIAGVEKVYLQKAVFKNKEVLNTHFFADKKEVTESTLLNYKKILSRYCSVCEIRN